MTIYYKATRMDGTDFYSGTVDYAGALESGKRVRVSTPKSDYYRCCTSDVLHASSMPTETLIGGSWPCRLFEVSGRPVAREGHKRGFRTLKVEREIEGWGALGPQGKQIAALIDAAGKLTRQNVLDLDAACGAAWDAAWDAAWGAARDAALGAARDAARGAARDAAWGAARDAAWGAAWGAAGSLCLRDLVGIDSRFQQEHYDLLTKAWREVMGPIHEDDPDIRKVVAQ